MLADGELHYGTRRNTYIYSTDPRELARGRLPSPPPDTSPRTLNADNERRSTADDNERRALSTLVSRIDDSRGSLTLVDSWLKTLPPEIASLTDCKTIYLAGNRLRTLPPEIGSLRALVSLHLNSNHLTQLPVAIGDLSALTTLILAENRLNAVPSAIGNLEHLGTLDLGLNRLKRLPKTIGRLQRLRELDLKGNRLTKIPSTIGDLHALVSLDLSDNRLTELPASLGRLTSLKVLNLEGNPLRAPLGTLAASGIGDVLAYLRSLEDAEPQYSAKLLLVGEGNIGKTSLIAALRDEDFVEVRDTTHGIEQSLLTLPHPTETVEISLNAWDFGGQELYRITNQFFFSTDALYLLVWRPREGRDENAVDEWCRRIRLRVGAAARIIIVATHAHECVPELDYPQLQREFGPLLRGHFTVDNSDSLGIPTLRTSLAEEASRLPPMGELLSSSWREARDSILAMAASNPQITYDEFSALCHRSGVTPDEVGALARLLHKLGHVIYYGEDDGLRDVMVLQPEWLTRAIGRVLEDPLIRANGGIMEHSALAGIWGFTCDGYSAENRPYFLRLMEKFDVSYRIPDEDASLVGQLARILHEGFDVGVGGDGEGWGRLRSLRGGGVCGFCGVMGGGGGGGVLFADRLRGARRAGGRLSVGGAGGGVRGQARGAF
jgi:hypothetical protein